MAVLRGQPGYFLFLICYQHILRLQCHALINIKGFPAEFERIVKELWALRLPLIHEKFGSTQKPGNDVEGGAASISQTLYSSQPQESESEGPTEVGHGRHRTLPKLLDTLGLLYLGAMLLRIPLGIADLHAWAVTGEIPYLRLENSIPRDIESNLERRYQEILLNVRRFKNVDLHASIRRLLILYAEELKLTIPDLNYQPLLFLHIQRLALPVQILGPVQHLATLLKYDFSFCNENFTWAADGTQYLIKRLPWLPESIMLAMLIVATKLYFPFPPAPKYYLKSESDPFLFSLSWPAWSRAHQEARGMEQEPFTLKPGTEMELREDDVFGLSGRQMDAYMEWYAQNILPKKGDGFSARYNPYKLSEPLRDIFPVQYGAMLAERQLQDTRDGEGQPILLAKNADKELEDISARLSAVVQSLDIREVVKDDSPAAKAAEVRGECIRRLGRLYLKYPKEKDLSGIALEFHEQAAELVGLKLQQLLWLVRRVEMKLKVQEKK